MLFHNVLCVCFAALLAPKIETNAQPDSKTGNATEPDILFADVIKNISRVNNELQNLVKNYEHFKYNYSHASQEDFANVKITYASDSDGGRVNRNSKTNNRNPSDERTTNPNPTEMIFVEDETENSETDNSSEAKTTTQKQKSDESLEGDSIKLPVNTVKNTQKVQTTTEPSIISKVPTDALLVPNNEGTELDNDELEAIHDMKTKTERLKQILSKAYQETNQTKNIEYEKETKYLGDDAPKDSSESEISTEVKRYSEEREKSELELKRAFDENYVAVTAGIFLRSQVILNTTTTTKASKNGSLEWADSDENLSKEVNQTKVLRKAYGDACSKLVIKKCHKACRSASKVACRAAMKCKEDFKTHFKDKSKPACIKAFQPTILRRNADSKTIDEGITQDEYLSVACQTPIRRNVDQVPKPANNKNESLNILRDKYERACAKISKNKCTKACHSALDSACDRYKCMKKQKKNFKKHCKTQCKRFYLGKAKIGGSSDDSDDNDSDSDVSDSSDDSSSSDGKSDSDKSSDDKEKDKDKKKDKDKDRKVLKA